MNFVRNYENLLNFVKVMPKILGVPFFPDTVYNSALYSNVYCTDRQSYWMTHVADVTRSLYVFATLI